jgi:hypothetical protein
MPANDSEAARSAMYALGMRHATLEAEGDLEGTMATLVQDPVYEFWPAGRRMVGREAVRRYYEHLVADFMPRQIGYELIAETLSGGALSQEYVIELEGPDGPERHRVLGILVGDTERPDLLAGERIWGDEAFLRRMIGPIWDELEVIDR